ncbi:MAG: hypothetical protein NTZ46_10080 [Verrucomicrobia bacterium]|nr:hypothetical protein [Verrucomicrobiota bacterium]
MKRFPVLSWLLLLVGIPGATLAADVLRNDLYTLVADKNGAITIQVAGMPPQRLAPEFTVFWSKTDPGCKRHAGHHNYGASPRTAVRWSNVNEPLDSINAWLSSPELKAATGLTGSARGEGKARIIEFKDANGKVTIHVAGAEACDTTRPFTVGSPIVMKPVRTTVAANRIHWEYPVEPGFTLSAELVLPVGKGDPHLTFTLIPKLDGYYSVAFTGAPDAPLTKTLLVPQECESRGHKLFDYVVTESDLRLPRAHVATAEGNIALAADPRECRFRLPTIADSRFGLMLALEKDRLKPVLFAPLLGGPESRMRSGKPWQFTFVCVVKPGDWKETYAHIAQNIQGFRDLRDNSGPGSINGTLERVIDYLADRHGGNHALWDPQQKYYDYFTDKTGIFKPFSPLYGLSAAIVTDDEEFFNKRALPAVEFAISRRSSVFAPYDFVTDKQASTAERTVGAPYIGYAQLVSIYELFGGRTPILRTMAKAGESAQGKISEMIARWRLTGDAGALAAARKTVNKSKSSRTSFSEEDIFDLLDIAEATRDPQDIQTAVAAAYSNSIMLNLYPVPPDSMVTVDRGGLGPVHPHSVLRHRNIWGFPPPQPIHVPEQSVPAWRIARLGTESPAYPMEYWMNLNGAIMRIAGLAHDSFLRDIARWGMVGRFGNYAGDNRSKDSLVAELPDAVDCMPWEWNFATVNPGHAWDFVGSVLDFLVSDAFERSHGAISFPTLSAAGSHFRVQIHGGKPGVFYGDKDVHLWLPRGLVTSNNRQLDWVAGHGNGNLYLALWNQSFREETAEITLDPALVECAPAQARVWRDNAIAAPARSNGNRFNVTISPKGILAFAIPAKVKPRLQAKLYDASTPALGSGSFADATAPFGPVHAMLLRAGRGLTHAFVYTEALPENVIGARLRWRQGNGPWQEQTDTIYPYEFSPELSDNGGDFACVLEIENNKQEIQSAPVITLALGEKKNSPHIDVPACTTPIVPPPVNPASPAPEVGISADFVSYIQHAANGKEYGLHPDKRYYPYSTPQGRRIGARQILWDKALYAKGCSREEAEQHLRADLSRVLAELKRVLAARQPSVSFDKLGRRQQETLLDLAYTETVGGLSPKLISAVLADDWNRVVNEHLYVRFAGHAPDHVRNKAFAVRWGIP